MSYSITRVPRSPGSGRRPRAWRPAGASGPPAARERLPPTQIGRFGQVQEWLEDWDTPTDTHRHIAQLYGLFPSDQITPEETPELIKAADTLSSYIKCQTEIGAGNAEFSKAAQDVSDRLRAFELPEVEYFLKVFVPSYQLTLDELLNNGTRHLPK